MGRKSTNQTPSRNNQVDTIDLVELGRALLFHWKPILAAGMGIRDEKICDRRCRMPGSGSRFADCSVCQSDVEKSQFSPF